jgi:hypothetical protein
MFGHLSKEMDGFHFQLTGCVKVKGEDARLYAAVKVVNFAIRWESIFQRERFAFDETKYQTKK